MVKCPALQKGQLTSKFFRNYSKKGSYLMAKCANCGKATTFGHSRSFSQRATNRPFKPNLQKTIVMEQGRVVHKVLCTKCIKAMGKSVA
jgi:large subunit ribosomal protein L28